MIQSSSPVIIISTYIGANTAGSIQTNSSITNTVTTIQAGSEVTDKHRLITVWSLETRMTTTPISSRIRRDTITIQARITLTHIESLTTLGASETGRTQTLVVQVRSLNTRDSMHTWLRIAWINLGLTQVTG